jgi:HEPN domain-containing protein
MDEALRRQAEEWFERGQREIETAQLVYEQRGHTDAIAYHIQQAIEKYLKGYLVLHGRKPPKTHELDALLSHITSFDDGFNHFLELCEKASRFYIEGRYPPGPPAAYDYEEVRADLDEAVKLINELQAKANL